MPDSEKISARELKDFLTGQVRKLRLLKRFLIVLIILVALAILGHVIYYFNSLTNMRYDVITAKSQVESAIQYRANLVPVLIESVTGFVGHEDDVFNRAVDARERSLTAARQAVAELRKAGSQPMKEMLQKIMAIAEQYPDLKTSEAFQLLMTQVTNAEAEILKQRIAYNDYVNTYTTAMSMFPGNFYAAVFNFPSFEYFKGTWQSEWPQVTVQSPVESQGRADDG